MSAFDQSSRLGVIEKMRLGVGLPGTLADGSKDSDERSYLQSSVVRARELEQNYRRRLTRVSILGKPSVWRLGEFVTVLLAEDGPVRLVALELGKWDVIAPFGADKFGFVGATAVAKRMTADAADRD